MAQVRDPVCNMTIDSTSAAGQTSYQGRNYYFCSDQCASRFQANPGKYAGQQTTSSPHSEAERRSETR
ncbi:MAG TPA: YHS domain-containing protein [Gemmatimonadaceae bacterium]